MTRQCLSLGLVLALLGCGRTQSAERTSSEPAAIPPPSFEVEAVRDIAYYDGPDSDARKHKLDLYLPKGHKDFPVVLFVHGGAWRSGDKNYFFDVYGKLGSQFARHGIGAVVTNYRLSPKVKHPAHVEDVAKAFAWTHNNIAKHGGRSEQIFLCGHSAGGHLVALLATNERYLKAENLSLDQVKGVIPISGVYQLPPGKLFESVFPLEDAIRRDASPLQQVNGKHPPFLIIYGDHDFPTCDRVSQEFCKALGKCKCEVKTLEVKDRDHLGIIAKMCNEGDPTLEASLQFIAKHAGMKVKSNTQ